MEQVQGEEEVLRVKELVGLAKEVAFVRLNGAFERSGGRRHLPRLEQRCAGPRHLQKNILTQDGKIPLENILVVRVPPEALLIRIVVAPRMALAVAIPLGETDAPAIYDQTDMVLFLLLHRP